MCCAQTLESLLLKKAFCLYAVTYCTVQTKTLVLVYLPCQTAHNTKKGLQIMSIQTGNAVVFGAGNIGLGFLGSLLWQSGYHTTFIDVNEVRLEAINRDGAYTVNEVSVDGASSHVVTDISGIQAHDPKAVDAIMNADIVLTAVGKGALPHVAKPLAKGIRKRLESKWLSEMHIVVIACENLIENTSYLMRHVLAEIPDTLHSNVMSCISFPNCVVDRIVPNSSGEVGEGIQITVEEYYQLVVDETMLLAPLPKITGMDLTSNLDAAISQKLFTLNMGHALLGYFGYLKGHAFVHESLQDRHVSQLLDGAFQEVEQALVATHGIPVLDQRAYAQMVKRRFLNPHLKDEVSRVARDPIRKLGPKDRIVGPIISCFKQGMIPPFLTAGAAAVLGFDATQDKEAIQLQRDLQHRSLGEVIAEKTTIKQGTDLNRMIQSQYLLFV